MIRAIVTRLVILAAAVLVAAPATAITLSIDYSYDSNQFFGSGNPQGPAGGLQARAALEAAADFYSDILSDTFSAIQAPPIYHSSHYNGMVVWTWTMSFTSPGSGAPINLTNKTILADDYRIYVGGRSLAGSTSGLGGPGSYSWARYPSGSFTPAEMDEWQQIEEDFVNTLEHRGETSGFADWGGAITFDNDGTTNWHFDYTTQPTAGKSDFYSTAIHELAHTLGFGVAPDWQSLVNGSVFTGQASRDEYGGDVPLSGDKAHWAEGTMSTVFGTAVPQEAAMGPSLTAGTRKRLTHLDAAGLTDIGWSVEAPPALAGDYNGNGVVDAADYTVWRDDPGLFPADAFNVWKSNFGNTLGSGAFTPAAVPEPASGALWCVSLLGAIAVRHGVRRDHPRRRIVLGSPAI